MVTFGLVAGPSKTLVTEAETKSMNDKKTEGNASEGEELGRWDVIVRREVAGKPITVFDIR